MKLPRCKNIKRQAGRKSGRLQSGLWPHKATRAVYQAPADACQNTGLQIERVWFHAPDLRPGTALQYCHSDSQNSTVPPTSDSRKYVVPLRYEGSSASAVPRLTEQ